MGEIKIDSVVQAVGENFVRRVVAIEGTRARCQRFGKNEAKWFELSDLRIDGNHGPMRVTFP